MVDCTECPVCTSAYDDQDHKPVIYCSNNHHICQSCSNELKRRRSHGQCPKCRVLSYFEPKASCEHSEVLQQINELKERALTTESFSKLQTIMEASRIRNEEAAERNIQETRKFKEAVASQYDSLMKKEYEYGQYQLKIAKLKKDIIEIEKEIEHKEEQVQQFKEEGFQTGKREWETTKEPGYRAQLRQEYEKALDSSIQWHKDIISRENQRREASFEIEMKKRRDKMEREEEEQRNQLNREEVAFYKYLDDIKETGLRKTQEEISVIIKRHSSKTTFQDEMDEYKYALQNSKKNYKEMLFKTCRNDFILKYRNAFYDSVKESVESSVVLAKEKAQAAALEEKEAAKVDDFYKKRKAEIQKELEAYKRKIKKRLDSQAEEKYAEWEAQDNERKQMKSIEELFYTHRKDFMKHLRYICEGVKPENSGIHQVEYRRIKKQLSNCLEFMERFTNQM